MSAEILKSEAPKDTSGVPHPTDDASPFSIPDIVLNGTEMTKISKKGKKRVVFRIDPDEGRLLYKSKKGGLVPIEAIKEMRSGEDARYYCNQFEQPEEAESRWITVIYILGGAYKTLHILADTRDAFHAWDTTLRKLHSVRQGLTTGLGNMETREEVWERQYWKGADEEGDQVLDFDDVDRLCKRLHANIPTPRLQQLFKEADTENKGHLDYPAFQRFVKKLKRRPDVEQIYGQIAGQSGGKFDFAAFEKFIKEVQKSPLSTDELRAVFDKYATSADSTSPNEPSGALTLDAFTKFLTSPDNAAFAEEGKPIWQDMTKPISEYFISSSHNTYLVGNQLTGVSTIEGYIRALLHSCRSVELDIYDGDDEPVIFHGKTLTSKVPLRDVCVAIMKYGFTTSPYPLLVSAEVHCGLAQQEKMVDVMTEVWGDALIQAPVNGRPQLTHLPSPEDLKHKILLKAKNLYVVEQLAKAKAKRAEEKAAVLEADPSSESTNESTDDDAGESKPGALGALKSRWRKMRGKDPKPAKPKVKMSFRLASLLVYTIGVKCHGLNDEVQYAPEHIFSLSEYSANKLLKVGMWDLIRHTQGHLVRIYPKGTRVNSTNFEPHRYWASGAQVVAINWQTFDLGYVMNQAMFQRNGRSGYILKPEALRSLDKDLFSKRTKHFLDITIISAQQLPPLRDSKGNEVFGKSIPDPFVEVSLLIPDWTNSPFLPESAKAEGAEYHSPSEGNTTTATSARTVKMKTQVVTDNGFNPTWNEQLHLPFDCVGGMMDLIFVNIAVRQEGKEDEDDEPLAMYCIPLGSLNQGYRHLPLHDAQMNQHLFSTLFVNVAIRDAD
ncbi:1-phosphatidylinositol-4,5-bisphosphate phosphodiesterase 1 [Coprinopsis cinerea AmutBmut pab1-1]|nr:1-phosphatidylinositol-4,5-bisphosphate phosphodiesterase 1 [Coprinopsis cinerea AmutBmut pab1-1]